MIFVIIISHGKSLCGENEALILLPCKKNHVNECQIIFFLHLFCSHFHLNEVIQTLCERV